MSRFPAVQDPPHSAFWGGVLNCRMARVSGKWGGENESFPCSSGPPPILHFGGGPELQENLCSPGLCRVAELSRLVPRRRALPDVTASPGRNKTRAKKTRANKHPGEKTTRAKTNRAKTTPGETKTGEQKPGRKHPGENNPARKTPGRNKHGRTKTSGQKLCPGEWSGERAGGRASGRAGYSPGGQAGGRVDGRADGRVSKRAGGFYLEFHSAGPGVSQAHSRASRGRF